MENPNIEREKWLRQRSQIYFLFVFLYFSIGLDQMLRYNSLWYYVKNDIESTNYYFNYELIYAGCYTLPLLTSIPVTRWFDKNRPLKRTIIIMSLIGAVGYVFYSIPFSPYYPFTGTILQGVSFISRGIMNSEMMLLYGTRDIASCFLMATCMYGAGQCIAPLILLGSEKIRFWIGSIPITYGNIQGLILFGISVVRVVLFSIFCHDKLYLSEKKGEERSLDERDNSDEEQDKLLKKENSKEEKQATTTKDVQIDSCIILVQQFLMITLGTQILIPVVPLIVGYLGYNKTVTSWLFFVDSVIVTVFSFFGKMLKLSPIGIYYCGIIGLLMLIIAYVVMGLLLALKSSDFALNMLLMAIFVFCRKISWICEITFVPVTLGKLNDPSRQSLIEGIRLTSKLFGALVSSFLAPYLYQYYFYMLPVFSVLILLAMFVVVYRKQTLILKTENYSC